MQVTREKEENRKRIQEEQERQAKAARINGERVQKGM